jgi:hypothetical protein
MRAVAAKDGRRQRVRTGAAPTRAEVTMAAAQRIAFAT